jgi:uncharacterized OB-fold protein
MSELATMTTQLEEPIYQATVVEFPHVHFTGPVVGRFLAGLKEQKTIWGQRAAGQGVVVPPPGYSEVDGSAGGEWVAVQDTGVVTAVAIVHHPLEKLHPLSAPFAFVLVRLDGADTAMAHVVKEGLDTLKVGSRVQAVWAADDERRGTIRDIACFRVIHSGQQPGLQKRPGRELMHEPPQEPVKQIEAYMWLPYNYVAGDYKARFLRALKNKKIVGSKCSKTGKVFVPPLMNSPESFAPANEFVEVADRGVVTTFCIVNIPVVGRQLQLPYACASVALDGADVSIFTLIQECAAKDVRMGLRVEAVWKPDGEREGTWDDIIHFRPTGEPDAPPESYINRL